MDTQKLNDLEKELNRLKRIMNSRKNSVQVREAANKRFSELNTEYFNMFNKTPKVKAASYNFNKLYHTEE